MKTKYFIAAVILLFAVSVFNGCETKNENIEDAKQNVKDSKQELKDAQAQYEREWQQFKSDVELKIRNNDKKIAEFKQAPRKFRTQYEKEVLVLEQKNIELRKKLAEYRYEGKDSWETFKDGFNREVDVVITGLNDIFSKKN